MKKTAKHIQPIATWRVNRSGQLELFTQSPKKRHTDCTMRDQAELLPPEGDFRSDEISCLMKGIYLESRSSLRTDQAKLDFPSKDLYIGNLIS